MPESGAAALVLGIDFGERRMGLASGNTLTGTARPLPTLHYRGDPFAPLEQVLNEWRPGQVVVGLPLARDGSDSHFTRTVRDFAERLSERHPDLDVRLHDERYSSRHAERQFAEARRAGRARRRDARNLDSLAAAIIVESWLARPAASDSSAGVRE